MTGKKKRKEKKVRISRDSGVKVLRKIEKLVGSDGGKGKDLLIRCIPGPEESEEYQTSLQMARTEAKREGEIANPEDFIIALPPEEAVVYLGEEKLARVEVFDKGKILPTNYKNVYQIPQVPGFYWFLAKE